MLKGPGQEQTRIELHLLHGLKSGKIAGISGWAVELFAIGSDSNAALSAQSLTATVVCVTFAVTFDDAIGTSGSNFVIGTGIATKALELLVLGKDELEMVATLFDIEDEDPFETSGSNFVVGTGIATKAVELLVMVLGKDGLEMVAMLFDIEVGSRSSTLLAKLGIANGVLEFPAIVLVAEAFIGKVHIARACANI